MEKKNNKLALMSMLTICLSLLLMNVGRLNGIVPDSVIRIIGVAVMIAAAVSIFFTVRTLAEHTSKNKKDKGEK